MEIFNSCIHKAELFNNPSIKAFFTRFSKKQANSIFLKKKTW